MQLVSVQADEDFTNKTSAISLIDSQGNALETVRSIAGVAYISLTKISVPLPDGAHWVSITPADTHVDPKIASTLGSNDPSSGLKYLSAVNGDPKVIDTEKLDGADVTHYGFTVNLATLFDAVGKGGDALGVPGMGAGLA